MVCYYSIVPKRKISRMAKVQESDADLLGHLMVTASKVAKGEGLDAGYRLVGKFLSTINIIFTYR